jgi:hypothetical protein
MMITTDWVSFPKHGMLCRIRATYGFDVEFAARHNQAPHFSMTGEIEEYRNVGGRWREHSCGSIHEDIVAQFPHLARLVKWHLTSTVEPLHYMANGMFWYDEGKRLGWKVIDTAHFLRTNSLQNLRKTIVYGACVGDRAVKLTKISREKLAAWLESRKPVLMGEFRHDMIAFGLDFPGLI